MQATVLSATRREKLGKRANRRLRREGQLPIVLYGLEQESLSLAVDCLQLVKAFRQGARLFDVKLGEVVERVLLKEVQYDPFGEVVLHVDFHRIAMDQAVTLEVALRFKNVPVGVTRDGGVLEEHLSRLEISCMPDSIPQAIEVDIRPLELGQTLHLRDLPLPAGVELASDPELVVLSVRHAREEEEEEEVAAEPGPAEPQVIGREAREGAEQQD